MTVSGGYIPLNYIVDFLKFLKSNSHQIQIITYEDLLWGDDFDYENNYPEEWKRYQRFSKGLNSNEKISVLLQHDVDSSPERTIKILEEEECLNIPSNVMIFNRRVDRRHLQKTGQLVYTDYCLDFDYLRKLQDHKRFVIGYHSNVYEQSLFDREKALRLFEMEVQSLRKDFEVSFFSPHGGPRDSAGQSNNSLPIPESLQNSIRWVANAHTPRFHGSYSDGGINSLSRDPDKRDLRDFVQTWQPGKRYRVLLHPQYYCSYCMRSPRLSGTAWYEEVLSCYQENSKYSAWDGIELGFK